MTNGGHDIRRIARRGFDRLATAVAAAVERGSSHLMARTLLAAAERAGAVAGPATNVREAPGRGVTGGVDGRRVVVGVARDIGIDEAHGDLLPADKVRFVERLVDEGDAVVMVGDGINDAPALSTATAGIALAGHGGGILAEAADVVVLVDELPRVAEAVRVSRHAVRTRSSASASGWA